MSPKAESTLSSCTLFGSLMGVVCGVNRKVGLCPVVCLRVLWYNEVMKISIVLEEGAKQETFDASNVTSKNIKQIFNNAEDCFLNSGLFEREKMKFYKELAPEKKQKVDDYMARIGCTISKMYYSYLKAIVI